MKKFFRCQLFVRSLIVVIIPVMLGCQFLSRALPTPNESNSAGSESPTPGEVDLELGPGDFNFPNTLVGLDALSSFKAFLTISFEGTEAGQPASWSNISVLTFQKDPPARTLKFETTAQVQSPQPVLRAVMNGAEYEINEDGVCTADQIDPADPVIEYMHPAIAISGVFGAEESGNETINGMETDHYTFDERAIAQVGLNESMGELWVASQGGYLVRYHLTTSGDESYFGEGTNGTITWDYELSEINQVPPIELPENCPPGILDAPLLDDAYDVVNAPGILQYQTAVNVLDAIAFYEQQLPNLGWMVPDPAEAQLPGDPEMEGISPEEMEQVLDMMESMGMGPGQSSEPTATPDPNKGSLTYQRSSFELIVFISRIDTSTKVLLALRNRSQQAP